MRRIYRADEYDVADSAPIPLPMLGKQAGFEPVQIGRTPWPSRDDLTRLRQKAEEEGYQAGLLKAEQEAGAQRQRDALALRHLLEGLAHPFEDLNDTIGREIAALALQIGSTLAGKALAIEPELLVPVVVDAVAALPSQARDVNVLLHPDDVALVRERLQVELDHVSFVADDRLKRGDCLVRSEASTVDASLKARIERLCQALPGLPGSEEDC